MKPGIYRAERARRLSAKPSCAMRKTGQRISVSPVLGRAWQGASRILTRSLSEARWIYPPSSHAARTPPALQKSSQRATSGFNIPTVVADCTLLSKAVEPARVDPRRERCLFSVVVAATMWRPLHLTPWQARRLPVHPCVDRLFLAFIGAPRPAHRAVRSCAPAAVRWHLHGLPEFSGN